MKRRNLYSLIMLAGGLLAACNPDGVDSVSFDVAVESGVKEVYVGDPVTFAFDGKPDHVVFYSGEFGNRYSDKSRTEVELESVTLSTIINQRCWTGALLRGQRLYAYISEDFGGVYTKEGIEAATWTEISGTGEGQIPVPTCATTWDDTAKGKIDFSAYKDKPFYLAFQYLIPKDENAYGNQPRILVNQLKMDKATVEGERLRMDSPQREFGFQYVQKIGNLTEAANKGSLPVDNTKLGFQPVNAMGAELDIWAVSQRINLKVAPASVGTPVKTLSSKISSHTHTYAQAGEYTVTFVASNANMWNAEAVVREIKIIVKEKTEN